MGVNFGVNFFAFDTRLEWLKARGRTIGGSDAACLVGMNPWKSNVDLYHSLTSMEEPEEQTNPAMEYGTKAEAPLRELFKVDHPELIVRYKENNLWTNDDFPFGHASLDGWIEDPEENKIGVLEIKTATIQNAAQGEKWRDSIPDNYYCQLLWYMGLCDFDFAYLRAQLKSGYGWATQLVEFRIDREECQEDIDILFGMAKKFWHYVEIGQEPPLILPEV